MNRVRGETKYADVITLITSAAYVGEETQAEFGRIPPAFIPIGSAYLIRHQLHHLRDRHHKFVSLPTEFELSQPQFQLLEREEVSVVRVNPEISLGMSVLQAILEVGPGKPLEIFHGDTLVISPPKPEVDAISVEAVTHYYKWGLVSTDKGMVTEICDANINEGATNGYQMLSGYFYFEDTWEFIKSLMRQEFNFVSALNDYIQTKTVRARPEIKTHDCGHLKTLYATRRQLAASRHFNSLVIDDYFVLKRSDDHRKIAAEANWLSSIPADLQPFTARLIVDSGCGADGEYRTLYSSYPTLAELYLAQSPRLVWNKVIDSCLEFLKREQLHNGPSMETYFEWLVIGKLRERLRGYSHFLPPFNELLHINGQCVGTLESIVNHLEAVVTAAPKIPNCVMHGDFCFSNILFDFRADRIMLIDPRGMIRDVETIYGDIRYDIAKLGHSFVGRYDQIMAEGLRAQGSGADLKLSIPTDAHRDWLQNAFLDSHVGNVSFSSIEIKAAIVSLFLSMIPLHSEDPLRQKTLFANGLRLYADYLHKTASDSSYRLEKSA